MTSHPEFTKETTSELVVDSFRTQVQGKTRVSPNGLGEAMIKALASAKPALIIATARSPEKADTVIQNIRNTQPDLNAKVLQMDLSSIVSVRQAATELSILTNVVDILINNAGVMGIPSQTLSVDGIEMHLATNFVGHFLFANLIMPQLLNSHNARVVNISNAGHVLTPIRFSDLNYSGNISLPDEELPRLDVAKQMGMAELMPQNIVEYLPLLAYSQSGTANMLFSVMLADRLKEKHISTFSAAPGVVETELQRHMPKGFRNPHMFYKTHSQGAATFLVAALDPKITEHNGAYLDDCQIAQASPHATDKTAAARLWKATEELVKQKFDT